MLKKLLYSFLFFILATTAIKAQIKITGRVFLGDSANHKPKAGVLVKTSAGAKAFSNDSGYYTINMKQSDTLEFYYKGNLVSAYPFTYLTSFSRFDIYIDNNTGFAGGIHNLGTVRVKANGNKEALATREKYADVFSPKKRKISMGDNKWKESTTFMGTKVPINTMDKKASLLDIGSVSDALSFKKKKQARLNQKFAINNEHNNYIQRRFTKSLIAKYTNMQDDDSLNYFIAYYAPPYEKLKNMGEMELGQYIIDNMKLFRLEGKKEGK